MRFASSEGQITYFLKILRITTPYRRPQSPGFAVTSTCKISAVSRETTGWFILISMILMML